MARAEQMARNQSFETDVYRWIGGAAVGLASVLGSIVWVRIGAAEFTGHSNTERIGQVETHVEDESRLLHEINSDIKEVRDAVRRMEGSQQHAPNQP